MYNVFLNTPDGYCLDTIESAYPSTVDDNDMGFTGLLLYPSDGGDTWLVIMTEEDTKVRMRELFENKQCDLTAFTSVYLDEDCKVTYDSKQWLETHGVKMISRSRSLLDAVRLSSN